MPNLKDYPNGFRPHIKPHFNLTEPQKTFSKSTHINPIRLENNYPFVLNGKEYYLEVNIDYDDCIESIIISEVVKKDAVNENYERELDFYSKTKEKYEENLDKWRANKARWDKENLEEKEKKDRELFNELKKKFEPS